jgi:6-phosphogluconate dehydrogenase
VLTPASPATSLSKSKHPDTMSCDVGLYGLAVMGQNFALNMAEHGFKVCVGNRSESKVDATVERAKAEGNLPIVGAKSPQEFCANLKSPDGSSSWSRPGSPST